MTEKNNQRFESFGGVLLVVFTLLNLLVINDVASLWPIPEVTLLESVTIPLSTDQIAPLPHRVLSFIYQTNGLNEFALRVPAALCTMLLLGGFYVLGQRIFGKVASGLATVAMCCSFVLLSLGKVIGADAWLVMAQVFQILGLIFYIKQPKLEWTALSNIALLVGCYVAPWSMLIWTFVLLLGYGIWHPAGKNLIKLPFLLPMIAVWGITLAFGGLGWETPGLVFSWSSISLGKYLGYQLIGILPWFAFLPMAIWDSVKKIKKREELAIIYLVWLVAALACGSAVLQVIFCIMAARHALFFLQKNYPYRNAVVLFTVFHLVVAFFALFAFIMLAGYVQFGGPGYRASIAVAIAYWGASLVATTGVIGVNRKTMIGGITFAAVMGFLMFLVNAFPLIESRRGWNKRMVKKAATYRSPNTKTLWVMNIDEGDDAKSIELYAKNVQLEYVPQFPNEIIIDIVPDSEDLLVLPKADYLSQTNPQFILRDSILAYPEFFSPPVMLYIGKKKKR